jgi:hypothetical protein
MEFDLAVSGSSCSEPAGVACVKPVDRLVRRSKVRSKVRSKGRCKPPRSLRVSLDLRSSLAPPPVPVIGLGRTAATSCTTLYRAIRAGQVPVKVFMIGSEMRLALRQIDEWLDTQLLEASQPKAQPEPEPDVYAEVERLLATVGRSAGEIAHEIGRTAIFGLQELPVHVQRRRRIAMPERRARTRTRCRPCLGARNPLFYGVSDVLHLSALGGT